MNNKIRLLTHESYPCWYELSRDDKCGPMLRIHTDAIGVLESDLDPLTAWAVGVMGSDFLSDPRGGIGFNGNLKFLGERDDFLEYSIPLPECWKLTKAPHGNVKTYVYDEARIVLASLGIILERLYGFVGTTNSTRPQLMRLLVVPDTDRCSAVLTGDVSREYAGFLRNRPGIAYTSAENAALDTLRKMDNGVDEKHLAAVRVYTRSDGGIIIESTPGRACLYPTSFLNTNHGYEFTGSYFDDRMTQFAFIVALAKLCDLARNGTRK